MIASFMAVSWEQSMRLLCSPCAVQHACTLQAVGTLLGAMPALSALRSGEGLQHSPAAGSCMWQGYQLFTRVSHEPLLCMCAGAAGAAQAHDRGGRAHQPVDGLPDARGRAGLHEPAHQPAGCAAALCCLRASKRSLSLLSIASRSARWPVCAMVAHVPACDALHVAHGLLLRTEEWLDLAVLLPAAWGCCAHMQASEPAARLDC